MPDPAYWRMDRGSTHTTLYKDYTIVFIWIIIEVPMVEVRPD